MRGGWHDPLTHAHLAMFASGVCAGAMLVAIVWIAVAG